MLTRRIEQIVLVGSIVGGAMIVPQTSGLTASRDQMLALSNLDVASQLVALGLE